MVTAVEQNHTPIVQVAEPEAFLAKSDNPPAGGYVQRRYGFRPPVLSPAYELLLTTRRSGLAKIATAGHGA